MPKVSQRGFAHIFVLLILLLGLVAGVYLVQNGTKLFSRASVSGPTTPETSFTLVDANGSSCEGILCRIFTQTEVNGSVVKVDLYARSDIEPANLFSAKINFPTDLLLVSSIEKGSLIKDWVEDYYDNSTGEISIIGGVPNPGIKSEVGQPLNIATIIFQAKKEGKGTISFADNSEIFSNLNNINILTIKRNLDLEISKLTPTPVPTVTPVPSPTVIPSPQPTVTPAPNKGDGNNDGRISLADLSVLYSDMLKTSNFRIGIDMNGDGTINSFDYVLLRNLLVEKGVIRGTPSATPAPQSAKRVFVTSTTYNGNLGGLSGADAKCQERANVANLGGTWKVWLSDSTTSAASRLNHAAVPYKLLNGIVVANNWADLVDGTLQNGISVTELGATYYPGVRTGTQFDGSTSGPNNGYTCVDWQTDNNSGSAAMGMAGTKNYQWTSSNAYGCSAQLALYCFEQ